MKRLAKLIVLHLNCHTKVCASWQSKRDLIRQTHTNIKKFKDVVTEGNSVIFSFLCVFERNVVIIRARSAQLYKPTMCA